MFKVEKCFPEIRTEIKYPSTHVTMGQMIGFNDKWATYLGEGEAKCDKDNKFNKEFGRELAEVKAHINMLKNYKKKLISLTKEPEWRKPVGISQEIFKQVSIYLDDHTLKNIEEFVICTMDGKVLGTVKVEE